MARERELSFSPSLRAPAVPVVLAFAAGILIDRLTTITWATWLVVSMTFLFAWIAASRIDRPRITTMLLLFLCAAIGGGRHHSAWNVIAANDVSHFSMETPRPARVIGRIADAPAILAANRDPLASAWLQYDRTVCQLECRELWDGDRAIPVTGTARLEVTGHLLHANVGDEVEVTGLLSRPSGPRNPGGFDYRAHLRGRGIGCILRTGYPDAVIVRSKSSPYTLARIRQRIRAQCEASFVRHLSPRTLPIAMAIILGDRSRLDDDVQADFAESGTMHILAISGLHIGILAALIWWLCRICHLSPWTTAAVLVITVSSYAFVADTRPPVLRASILVVIAAAGMPIYRRVAPLNLLATAALLLLLANPVDLFDVGAQLSFLAVLAILWSLERQRTFVSREEFPGEQTVAGKLLADSSAWLAGGYRVSWAIWLFAAPLIAARFQLVSLVGLFVNVLLIPVVAVTLWLGFLFLACAALVPQIASIAAFGFDRGLAFLLDVANSCSEFSWGHIYVPQIPNWWLIGFYGALAVAASVSFSRVRHCWFWCGVWAWTAFGLGIGLMPSAEGKLQCTFLSVGHGCSILLETPDGSNLLYDAGMINNGPRAAQVVRRVLSERGRPWIDCLVISHADLDHFNAVPGLIRTIPVRSMAVSGDFLDMGQPGVRQVMKAAAEEHVKLQLLSSGDAIHPGSEEIEISVLHPPSHSDSESDNENSIVLSIGYRGRTILLCGDLEENGLRRLVQTPQPEVDVLMSPHHGSRRANTRELAAWAQPDRVVVSTGDDNIASTLQPVYGDDIRILSTREAGAVTVTIDRAGEVIAEAFTR